jgi:hypothetical protein
MIKTARPLGADEYHAMLDGLGDDRIEVYAAPAGSSAMPDDRQRTDSPRDSVVPVLIDGREVGRIAARDIRP